jgi:hypothetical protein
VEHDVKMKHVRLVVANELVLEHETNFVHGDVALLGKVMKLAGDRIEDPGDDDALHALPKSIIDGRGIKENVVDEVIASG